MKTAWLVAVVAVFSFSALGAETVCKSGNSERKIEVITAEGGKAPCEVKYTKEGEAEAKTLWNAQNDASFCTTKAGELVEKLSGTGWQCTGDIAASGAAEAKAATPAEIEGKTEGN
jgi:hypothetical protein